VLYNYTRARDGLNRIVARHFPKPIRKTKNPFIGKNLMTNIIIQQVEMPNGIWFELSMGTAIGMRSSYMIAVSFMDNKGTDFDKYNGIKPTLTEIVKTINKVKSLF
jgi:hypothetical protein